MTTTGEARVKAANGGLERGMTALKNVGARRMQTFGVLLANGITAVEALRMTERQISNRVHRRAFHEATDRVIEGESFSSALTRTKASSISEARPA